MITFKDMLNNFNESQDEIKDTETETDFSFQKEDIHEILDDLTQEELDEVGEFILEMIYEPDFDLDESDDEDEDDLEESEEMNEIRYFKTKNRELKRKRKQNISARKKAKKLRRKYYRKNKARLKRKQKLYKKKAKRRPTMVKRHRH